MLELTLAKVQPLLAKPPTAAQAPRISGWLAGLQVLLRSKYGETLTEAMEPLFLMFVADALQRRLDKAKQMVDSEGAGPFNVRWNAASSLGECFLTAEIEGMDEVTGFGGTRSYRTAAPDAIRYGNLAPVYFLDEELAIGEEEGVDVPLI